MARLIGGRYRVVETLGGGGTSLVFRAQPVHGGPDVAIKELRPQFAADPALRRRFLREAELARSLDHPGIVRILDAGQDASAPFLVLELVRGETLRQRLDRQGRLPFADARAVCTQLARALDHAHGRGVIHRDVKPQNVFLVPPQVKLADFGNARVVSLASVTGASLTWGTPEYVAPEMFMRGRADPRSDLYALGVVLHEMLTGKLPWSRAEVLTRLGVGGTSAPRLVPTEAGDSVDQLIGELLAFLPSDRPASGEEIVRRLSDPGPVAIVARATCGSCGAARPDDVPRCLACGTEIVRFKHDPAGRWRVVLRSLDDDAASTAKLLKLVEALAQPLNRPLQFLIGNRNLYSTEEQSAGISLPAVLFNNLDEASARKLASTFLAHGLDVRARKGTGENLPAAQNPYQGNMMRIVVLGAVVGAGIWKSGMPAVAWGPMLTLGLMLMGTHVIRSARHFLRAEGLLRLREQPAAVPIADQLLIEGARAANEARAPEVRALLADVTTELYRLTRRAEQLGARPAVPSSEAALLRRATGAAPGLSEQLGRLAAHLNALDAVLDGPTEGELMQTLARLERSAAAPGADREAAAAARRDLEAALERRHATEQERARLSAKLCQMLGRLRDVYRRARSLETLEEQETRAIEVAGAELDAFLAAP
jgi:hypothetical protein